MGLGYRFETPTTETGLRLALDPLERRLAEVDAAYADVQWRRHFDRMGQEELRRLEQLRAELLLDERVRETLADWEGRACDPLLSRRVALLSRRFRWARIESRPEIFVLRNRIDQAITAFRPRNLDHGEAVSGAVRLDMLRRHPDRERRRDAWRATEPLAAEIEADVRELMRRRQDLARRLGYAGFVAWALDISGLDPAWVESLFDELLRRTEPPYLTWLDEAARHLGLADGLRPWDVAFALHRTALPERAFSPDGLLPAARSVAEGLGLGAAAAAVRVDVTDLPYAALCYAVQPPRDVRILLNPRGGHGAYATLFHEFGHALYQRGMRPASPALLWEAAPFDEAMACIWERWAWEPDWLVQREGVTREQAALRPRHWAEQTVYRLRLRMAQASFEYRAYRNPDGDLTDLFQRTFTRYLGVPYDGISAWADSPFWTSHPVYLQNYVVAEAVASQALATLRRRFGRLIDEPRVGSWLVEKFYEPAGTLPWIEKVTRATGARPSLADLIADLGFDE